MQYIKTKPYDHQLQVLEETKDREYYGLLMEQGTGKTKIIIDNASFLFNNGRIRLVIVLAPNGVHSNWVYNEIPTHSAVPFEAFEWKSNGGKKWKEGLAELLKDLEKTGSSQCGDALHYLAVNIEAIRTQRCMNTLLTLLHSCPAMLVLDESTVIKNPKAIQSKNAMILAGSSTYRRILTGTPITQSPLDIFSQAKFLHPQALGQRFTWTAFKNTYAVEEIVNMGPRSFRKIKGYKNLDDLTSRLNQFSVRIMKKDCLDLPEKIYQNVYVEMTKEQERLYNEMKASALSQIDSGEVVSVTSALTLLMKLQQIVSGFIKDDEGNTHSITNNRVETLCRLFAEHEERVVVFCAFRRNIEQITSALEERFGKGTVVTYYGDTSTDDRTEAVRSFNDSGGVRFFVASSAASKGLTLTAASHTLYFSQSYSLETRLQSEDRIHRIGQTRHCIYTDLVTPNSTDEMITTALKQKHDLANLVLDDIRKVLV